MNITPSREQGGNISQSSNIYGASSIYQQGGSNLSQSRQSGYGMTSQQQPNISQSVQYGQGGQSHI